MYFDILWSFEAEIQDNDIIIFKILLLLAFEPDEKS